MDQRLQEVLRLNPFREKLVDGWTGSILNRAHDPFSEDVENANSAACVLECDRSSVSLVNTRHSCYESPFHMHGEFLPHPFLGHPSAPIWMLLVNPSWCHVDVFDMLNVSQEAVVYSESPLFDDPKQRAAVIDQDKTARFEHRLCLQQNQLLLREDAGFFPFDSSLETCAVGGNVSYGANGWWKKCLLGPGLPNFPFSAFRDVEDNESLGRKLFVLEFCPYRSRKFVPKTLKDINNGQSDYGRFWDELVRYAFEMQKIVVIRSTSNAKNNLIKNRLDELELDYTSPNVTFLKSCQKVTLSRRNFENEQVCDLMRAILQAEN